MRTAWQRLDGNLNDENDEERINGANNRNVERPAGLHHRRNGRNLDNDHYENVAEAHAPIPNAPEE